MLVITRKVGQSIRVGDDVEFTIIGYDRGLIKVGIDAPREIEIVRSEIIENDNIGNLKHDDRH